MLLRPGAEVGLISTGVQTVRALEAAQLLADKGIAAGVLHLPTIKPIDVDAIVTFAERTRRIVTAEDHSIIGGLGSAVAEVLAEHRPTLMRRVGIQRRLRRVSAKRLSARRLRSLPAPRCQSGAGALPRPVTTERSMPIHGLTGETERLAQQVLDLILARQRQDPWPLGAPATPEELERRVGRSITPAGIGATEALRRWVEGLHPANIAVDHPRYLAFIPHAPTEASIIFDALIGASAIYAGSWLEASGAVYAENEALRWLSDLAGFPPEAGGTFVPGGTLGNLSALHAARHAALVRRGGNRPPRWQVLTSSEAHSSIAQAARVLDMDLISVPGDASHRLTGDTLRASLAEHDSDGLVAVAASAGATNLGLIDDLAGIAAVCRERRRLAPRRRRLWPGCPGRAGRARRLCRHRACRQLHRRSPQVALRALRLLRPHLPRSAAGPRRPQPAAAYLDAINERNEWNPADYAVQLSRRARGLPFWFSLAVHGTDAYTAAIETTLTLTQQAADEIRSRPELELLLEPELTVLVFRRRGWATADYDAWSARLIESGIAFIMPTRYGGEPAARIVILNPRTTLADLQLVLDSTC